jgi:uncharacterized protein (TIGR02145 family)
MIITLLVVYFSTNEAAPLHGIVRNTAGQPLAGATVTLEKGKQKTTSASDGTFSFEVAASLRPLSPKPKNPLILRGESFVFDLSEAAKKSISVFTLQGRRIAKIETPNSGTQTLRIQPPGTGLYVCQLSDISDAPGLTGVFTKPSRTIASTGIFGDILRVDAHGFITNRQAVPIPDTTTIIITLITCIDSVTDFDGNVYHAVKIGNNVWTVENFRSTRYRNGAGIRINPSFGTWGMWTEGLFCYYDNSYDTMFRENYGALYNWYAVNNISGLAPKGWHVPTDTEWLELKTYLMNDKKYSWDGTTGENKIAKSLCAMTDWSASSVIGAVGNDMRSNNSTGFSALGGGCRWVSADYSSLNTSGYWWCSNKKDSTAYMFYMNTDRSSLEYSTRNIRYGLSVRLVRDR